MKITSRAQLWSTTLTIFHFSEQVWKYGSKAGGDQHWHQTRARGAGEPLQIWNVELLKKCKKSQSIQNSTWDESTYRRNNITSANVSDLIWFPKKICLVIPEQNPRCVAGLRSATPLPTWSGKFMLLKAVTSKTLINMGETSTYSPDSATLYKIILGLDAAQSSQISWTLKKLACYFCHKQ